MALELLEFTDTFTDWRNKINATIGNVNFSESAFGYDPSQSSGRIAHIFGGNVRRDSDVVYIEEQDISLPPSTISLLAIYIWEDEYTLRVYDIDDVPARRIIPLWVFETNSGSIIDSSDIRTQFIYTAPAEDVGPLVLFDDVINTDTVISGSKNGLSINVTVSEGTTVTVEEGSTWVVL